MSAEESSSSDEHNTEAFCVENGWILVIFHKFLTRTDHFFSFGQSVGLYWFSRGGFKRQGLDLSFRSAALQLYSFALTKRKREGGEILWEVLNLAYNIVIYIPVAY